MITKIVTQRQGKYDRYLLHIPATVIKTSGLSTVFVEWVVGDSNTIELWFHGHEPPTHDSLITKVTALYPTGVKTVIHYRTTVPKDIVNIMKLFNSRLEWALVSPRIYRLTVIRPKAKVVEGVDEKGGK